MTIGIILIVRITIMITGWPRFDLLRFRFVPVRFMNGSVRERFVFDRFASVLVTARFDSIQFWGGNVLQFVVFKAVHRGSLWFVALHQITHNRTSWLLFI